MGMYHHCSVPAAAVTHAVPLFRAEHACLVARKSLVLCQGAVCGMILVPGPQELLCSAYVFATLCGPGQHAPGEGEQRLATRRWGGGGVVGAP